MFLHFFNSYSQSSIIYVDVFFYPVYCRFFYPCSVCLLSSNNLLCLDILCPYLLCNLKNNGEHLV